MEDTDSVPVSRLTIATAADFLRDYARELEQAGSDGAYTAELDETVQVLEASLRDGN